MSISKQPSLPLETFAERFKILIAESTTRDKYSATSQIHPFIIQATEAQKTDFIEKFCEDVQTYELPTGVLLSILSATLKRRDVSPARTRLIEYTRQKIIKSVGRDASKRLLASVDF